MKKDSDFRSSSRLLYFLATREHLLHTMLCILLPALYYVSNILKRTLEYFATHS